MTTETFAVPPDVGGLVLRMLRPNERRSLRGACRATRNWPVADAEAVRPDDWRARDRYPLPAAVLCVPCSDYPALEAWARKMTAAGDRPTGRSADQWWGATCRTVVVEMSMIITSDVPVVIRVLFPECRVVVLPEKRADRDAARRLRDYEVVIRGHRVREGDWPTGWHSDSPPTDRDGKPLRWCALAVPNSADPAELERNVQIGLRRLVPWGMLVRHHVLWDAGARRTYTDWPVPKVTVCATDRSVTWAHCTADCSRTRAAATVAAPPGPIVCHALDVDVHPTHAAPLPPGVLGGNDAARWPVLRRLTVAAATKPAPVVADRFALATELLRGVPGIRLLVVHNLTEPDMAALVAAARCAPTRVPLVLRFYGFPPNLFGTVLAPQAQGGGRPVVVDRVMLGGCGTANDGLRGLMHAYSHPSVRPLAWHLRSVWIELCAGAIHPFDDSNDQALVLSPACALSAFAAFPALRYVTMVGGFMGQHGYARPVDR